MVFYTEHSLIASMTIKFSVKALYSVAVFLSHNRVIGKMQRKRKKNYQKKKKIENMKRLQS